MQNYTNVSESGPHIIYRFCLEAGDQEHETTKASHDASVVSLLLALVSATSKRLVMGLGP